MITISQLTELLGWASVINIAYLILATLALVFLRETISSIHSKMLDIEEKELSSKYFDFLSIYKIVTLSFYSCAIYCFKNYGSVSV